MKLAIEIIQREINQRELANTIEGHLRKKECDAEIESLKKFLTIPDLIEGVELILKYCGDVVNEHNVKLKDTRPFLITEKAVKKLTIERL
jgi:hypothetical protein